ncbi:MFS transporter [Paractinoplanes rhizophilus]|uniref:MFS transporter n=1 Tax=Paractinoplanes rhizophilus TaxID=1416877 RepID=A0ABW2HMR5_9ACTN|nr:MFS transporter [Actinoplanes sp.]
MKTTAALAPIAGASIAFYLPLAVVPLVAGSARAAGLSTGSFLVAGVLFELATPRIVARLGYRRSLAAGLLLLGLPALLFLASDATPVLVAANAVRGTGFAIATVAGSALTALAVPARRRGEGVALVGVVSGAGGLVALPLGLWAAHRYGYAPVFVVTAVAPLFALAGLRHLPSADVSDTGRAGSVGWRLPLIFAAGTAAAGVLVTFAPLAIGATIAPIALFVQPAVTTAARWIAGRVGDRIGQSALLLPGILLSAGGMAAFAGTGSAALVLLGAATFGAGFGILQNVTLTMMYARVPRSSYSAVSAVWNAAYDLGMAAGALGVGALIPAVGYPAAFLLTAAAMLSTILLAGSRKASVPMRAVPDMG